jgi:protein-S-isoprenylcysteine O-methyltransferase
MRLTSPEALGMAFGLSEAVLSILRRSGRSNDGHDQRSLRVLWVTIVCSVALAIAALQVLPAARSRLLEGCYMPGLLLFAGGLLLRWASIVHLGRFFTVDVAIAADHRLVESGPYRYLRHPSYSGALVAFAGLGICMANWLSLLALTVPVTWAFLRRIRVEETALRGAFGAAWDAYAGRTWRLLPFVY